MIHWVMSLWRFMSQFIIFILIFIFICLFTNCPKDLGYFVTFVSSIFRRSQYFKQLMN